MLRVEWVAVVLRPLFPKRLVLALAVGLLALPVPSAFARDCGQTVINDYFNTGHLGYHTQACYASALKQVDPDARMYSGIMGAIRAARARDKAADVKANQPPVDTTPIDTAPTPIDTLPLTTAPVPTETVQPAITAAPRTGPIKTEAALDTSSSQPNAPLPVIILGGVAALLMLVGLGGLAVRYLDRGY